MGCSNGKHAAGEHASKSADAELSPESKETEPDSIPQPGDHPESKIFSEYALCASSSELGAGAFSTVRVGVTLRPPLHQVAIKCTRRSGLADQEEVDSLYREASSCGLAHDYWVMI